MTQAERLFEALRRRPMTYGDMLELKVSTSPWKRVTEGLHRLKPGEKLVKGERKGLVTYRVVKG